MKRKTFRKKQLMDTAKVIVAMVIIMVATTTFADYVQKARYEEAMEETMNTKRAGGSNSAQDTDVGFCPPTAAGLQLLGIVDEE